MKKILIVEDDPFIVDIYASQLKGQGYNVDTANAGEMALEKIKNNCPDLLLLDLLLPKMDGWEILKEMKKTKGMKSMPVIILSNLSQRAEVEKGLKMGAVKYLIKAHYTPSEVVDEIKKVIH